MPAHRASAIAYLDLVRERGPLPADARLRVALDLLEPIAAGTALTRLVKRRAGSRFDVSNVRIAVRGRAKIVGAGNRSGLQILLWEVLAGQVAPEDGIPPLSAVVDDLEPEVAQVIDDAVGSHPDLPDARALLKALVVASAGAVGRRGATAKILSSQAAGTPAEAPEQPEEAAVAEAISTDDAVGATLDDVVTEELSKIAPDGWDTWDLSASAPEPEPPPEEEVIDGDDLVEELASQHPRGASDLPHPGPKRAPPPLEPRDPSLARPDVILIEPDPLTAAHLAGVVRRAGYVLEICSDASTGIGRACALQPKCVVCDDELVPGGGGEVALRARTNSPRACLAPFIFLAPRHRDPDAPRPRSGARDVWLEKPFSTDALLEHVKSFAGPATHPARAYASSMLPPSGEVAMHGDLSHISLATVVSMLKLERRSGSLGVTSREREARIAFVGGEPTKARVGGRPMRPQDALDIVATWTDGRFSFKTLPVATRATALA